MKNWSSYHDLEEHCENIDAAMFSGDAFLDKDNRDLLEKYIARWVRELPKQAKMAKEITGDGDVLLCIDEEDEPFEA
jgi:hypothetical protein